MQWAEGMKGFPLPSVWPSIMTLSHQGSLMIFLMATACPCWVEETRLIDKPAFSRAEKSHSQRPNLLFSRKQLAWVFINGVVLGLVLRTLPCFRLGFPAGCPLCGMFPCLAPSWAYLILSFFPALSWVSTATEWDLEDVSGFASWSLPWAYAPGLGWSICLRSHGEPEWDQA